MKTTLMKHELIISLLCVLLFGACNEENFEERLPDLPTEPIIVLYENDVHCAVDGYPMLVSLRNDCYIGLLYSRTRWGWHT